MFLSVFHSKPPTSVRTPILLLCALAVAASCGIIDEDNSDCGQQLTLRYPVMLSPQPAAEIGRELSAAGPAAAALTRALAAYDAAAQTGGYTDGLAHTLSMRFALTGGTLTRGGSALPPYYEEWSEPDSQQPVESIYLPFGTYSHVARANASRSTRASREANASRSTRASREADASRSQSCQMMAYSARRTITVDDETPATLTVPLYPVGSLVALVVDSTGVSGAAVTAAASGLATDFSADDSLYTFTPAADYALSPVAMPRPYAALAVCALPSNGAYTLTADVTLADGTVTRNIITVETPLLPGCLRIVRMRLRHDGSLATDLPGVAVAVTLHWRPGGTYEPTV